MKRAKVAVGNGQVRVTMRLSFADGTDTWESKVVMRDDAAREAARQVAAMIHGWEYKINETSGLRREDLT